jgi:glutamine amidotransferase
MASYLIVDYGMGNLHSVLGAMQFLGVDPKISADPAEVLMADVLILPGVGSYRRAMDQLTKTGLADALNEAVVHKQRKILGICLGMQLMAKQGTEDGSREGLGFFSGDVLRFPKVEGLKVPHVGFDNVNFNPNSCLGRGLGESTDFYFVHSYRLMPEYRPGVSGVCSYGDDFIATYEYKNIFATQFHPEKSQTNGLGLLSNFLNV